MPLKRVGKYPLATGKPNTSMTEVAMEYTTILESDGIQLLRRNDGKYCVIEVSHAANQVYSLMPGDQPSGSGRWFARNTPAGIDYVARGYSESYARKRFRAFIEERK